MEIISGITDQYIYFVAVDATDFSTRETGLDTFTVYGSKDGAAAAAFTTPTVNETDSSNMPGVYELLLDEQTTLAAGNDSEELCLHITHAGMAPVTRTVTLVRPKITAGYTLGVESDGDLTAVGSVTESRGKYANGAVWIGPASNTNTVSYTDGIITNPVSTIEAAKTIADALKLRRFYTIRTGTTQIGADIVGYDFDGNEWSCTTTGGSHDVSSSHFANALVVGGTYASTSAESHWDKCEFSDGVSVAAAHMNECTFAGTLTLNAAGNYDFIDCSSVVAGTSTPVFAIPAGVVNVSFRRWSGGISITGITADTTISIDVVSGGTVSLAGADGNVQVRGLVAGITDSRTGSPTLGQNAAVNITKINTEVDAAIEDAELPTATQIVDEFETQAAADPTGFKVNVMEVNGTSQTANDNGADINSILLQTGTNGVKIADAAIKSSTYDNSTAFALAQVDSESSAVARTGAGTETLQSLYVDIAALPTVVSIRQEMDSNSTSFSTIITAVGTTLPGRFDTVDAVLSDINGNTEDLGDNISDLNNITAADVVTALMASTDANNGTTYTFANQIQIITAYIAGAVTVTDNAYEYGDIDDDEAVITNTHTTSARSTVIA